MAQQQQPNQQANAGDEEPIFVGPIRYVIISVSNLFVVLTFYVHCSKRGLRAYLQRLITDADLDAEDILQTCYIALRVRNVRVTKYLRSDGPAFYPGVLKKRN